MKITQVITIRIHEDRTSTQAYTISLKKTRSATEKSLISFHCTDNGLFLILSVIRVESDVSLIESATQVGFRQSEVAALAKNTFP